MTGTFPSLRSPAVKAHRARSYRFRGGVARVAAWQGRSDVASLSLHGPDAPSRSILSRMLDDLYDAGYRAVVTNAVGPAASLPLADAGFAVQGRLHLLAHDLSGLDARSGRTRRESRADRPAVLATDAAAFDEFWRFDDIALREAGRATPSAQMRVAPAGRHGGPFGYGLFGRAGATGYVQRLAVAPAAQGNGFGRALLNDGMRWMRTRRAHRAFVNTQEDNDRALALYLRAGFRRLPDGLSVMGRDL